ncbi:hypothetical protein [Hymenobacter ruber]
MSETPEARPAWLPFIGEYEKEFYDVRTTDGKEHLECWPNAGYFHARNHDVIPSADVTHIRLAE